MSAVFQLPDFGLRVMTYEDLDDVLKIEQSVYPFPWTEGIFRDCLHVGYICRVYEKYDVILGYGVMSIVVDECHILNLCVKPQEQGGGVGRLMLRHLLMLARQCSADTALLEVRPSNQRAVGLYHSEGFNEVGSRINYYPTENGREDALILGKVL